MEIDICTKGHLINKVFRKLNRQEVREAIYKAVMKNRNIDIKAAKNIKVLRKNEVKAVCIDLGEIEE